MALNKIDPKSSIKYSTIIGTTPSVPLSDDHTDGSWNETDLYIGEYFMNSVDDRLWLRTDNGLMELVNTSTYSSTDIWEDTGSAIQLSATHSGKPILPATDDTSDLGSSTYRFKDLYLGSILDVSNHLTYSVGGSAIYKYDTNGIELITGKSISSNNGTSGLFMDAYGNAGNILLSSDGETYNESGIDIDSSYTGVYSYNGGNVYLDSDNSTVTVFDNISMHNNTLNLGIVINPSVIQARDTISIQKSTTVSTTNTGANAAHVFINSKNGFLGSGTLNSVILGGSGLTGSTSNTVYVPDLNIQPGKSILFLDSTNSGIGNIIAGIGCSSSSNYSLIVGNGNSNTSNESILAGTFNTNAGSRSIVVGDNCNIGTSAKSAILGSELCDIGNNGNNLAILGSKSSNINASLNRSVIIGGQDNIITTNDSVIIAGIGCTNSGDMSIVSGTFNTNSALGSIVSGLHNNNSDVYSILSGSSNTNSGFNSIVIGSGNTNSGDNSFVSGTNNTNSGDRSVIIGGDSITATEDDTAVALHMRVNGQLYTPIPAALSPTGTTQTINWDTGTIQIVSLFLATGNVTLTLTGPRAGATYKIKVNQHIGVFKDLIWPANVKWVGGTAPVITAAGLAIDLIELMYDGSNYYGTFNQNFS